MKEIEIKGNEGRRMKEGERGKEQERCETEIKEGGGRRERGKGGKQKRRRRKGVCNPESVCD